MKRTVLYIEDQYHNRRLVEKVLSARGYEVLLAEDGPTGWEILKNAVLHWCFWISRFRVDWMDSMSRHASRRIRTSGEYGSLRSRPQPCTWRSRAVSEPGL